MWAIEPRVYENIPGRKIRFRRKDKLKAALYEMLDGENVDVFECVMVWKDNLLIRRIVNYWRELYVIKAFPQYPVAQIDLDSLKTAE